MLRIAVCDDEKFYREKINTLLKKYLSERHFDGGIDIFCSGEEFLAQSENSIKYDIVFLDINMEQTDGIEAAKKIRMFHSDTYIVFVTAFIKYVLDGYKVDAVRYIMKDTLNTAIPECMDAIFQKMQVRQVSFSFMEGERRLYTDNLLYVESKKHKLIFFYQEEKLMGYQMYEKLDHIEKELAPYGFLRIHKSYLVNMRHIRRINNYMAVLSTGEELPVPRIRYQAVKQKFVEYKGLL